MGYVSQIGQFESKVREHDFEDVASIVFNGDKGNQAQRKRDIGLWNKFIGISPYDFAEIIQSRFYVDLEIDINLSRSGHMVVTLKGPDDLFIESFFSADLSAKKFSDKSTIRLFPRNENKGLANAWFACQVELYAALGADKVTHEATLMNGARKWARMGMYIDLERSDPKKLKRLSRNFKAKLEAFRKIGAVDEYRYQELLPFTDLVNPDDLVQLVKRDFDVPSPLISTDGVKISREFLKALSEYREANPLELDEDTAQAYAEKQAGHLVTIWNRAAPKQRPVKFSQYGLAYEHYDAVVHLDDVKQMQAIGWNVGGWKFGTV